jgi:hypothetical protein
MSARSGIVKAFAAELLSQFTGSGEYLTNLFNNNVSNKVYHFDNVPDFPFISVTPGPETRENLPSLQVWGFLTVYFRIYVRDTDDAQGQLEQIIADLEKFIDNTRLLAYNVNTPSGLETRNITDSNIQGITTDEGLLAPNGFGEIAVTIRYEKSRY